MEEENRSQIGMDVVNNCLVVPLGSLMNDRFLDHLGREIMARIGEVPVQGVIINVSSVKMMDSQDFLGLGKIVKSVSMMGTPAVLVGIRPGVASCLVDLDLDPGKMMFALSAEDAFEILGELTEQSRWSGRRPEHGPHL